MSRLQNKGNKTAHLAKIASGSLFLGAMVGLAGQATAAGYSVMGSGAEVRQALSSLNQMEKPAELKCGATESSNKAQTDKTSKVLKADKAAEMKCGEGKCGSQMKENKTDVKTKAVKKVQEKKAEKAVQHIKSESKKTMEMKSKAKKSESKTTEAKCGEGKCGS